MIDEGVREEVIKLREKGLSIATIAKQFGISRGSVYGILNGDGSDHDDIPLTKQGRRLTGTSTASLREEIEARKLSKVLAHMDATELAEEEKTERKERERRQEEMIIRLKEEQDERRKKERIEKIRRVKQVVIPSLFSSVPSEILTAAFIEIDNTLNQLDVDNLSDSELQTYARSGRQKVFSSPEHNRRVRFALRQAAAEMAFEVIDKILEDGLRVHQQCGGSLKTKDEYLNYYFAGLNSESQKNFVREMTLFLEEMRR
jgi:transposase